MTFLNLYIAYSYMYQPVKSQYYYLQCYVVDMWFCILFEGVTLVVLASIRTGDMSYVWLALFVLGLAACEGVWYKVCQDVEIAM